MNIKPQIEQTTSHHMTVKPYKDYPEKQFKQQNFRPFKSFSLFNDYDEPNRSQDKDITLFSHGFNREGKNVAQLIYNIFHSTHMLDSKIENKFYASLSPEMQIMYNIRKTLINMQEKQEESKRKNEAKIAKNIETKNHKEAKKAEQINEPKKLTFQEKVTIFKTKKKLKNENKKS